MTRSTFVYVIFIRTTPEHLWRALTSPGLTRQYWFGMHCESDWKPGSAWRLVSSDGGIANTGEIVDSDPPQRLVIKWRNEWDAALKAEGDALCTIEIEDVHDVIDKAVKLSITHSIERPESRLIKAVSEGWPRVLSNLKSVLETGAMVL